MHFAIEDLQDHDDDENYEREHHSSANTRTGVMVFQQKNKNNYINHKLSTHNQFPLLLYLRLGNW